MSVWEQTEYKTPGRQTFRKQASGAGEARAGGGEQVVWWKNWAGVSRGVPELKHFQFWGDWAAGQITRA